LGYHYHRVITQRGVGVEGNYYEDFAVHISCTLCTSPPTPPIAAQRPPTPSAPPLPDSPKSSKFKEGIPLSIVLGEVHMVMDLLGTPKLVELNSNDKLFEDFEEDPEEDPEEDLKLGTIKLIMASRMQSQAHHVAVLT